MFSIGLFLMVAAAAVSAGTAVHLFIGGKATKFQSFGDIMLNGFLNLMQFFLCIEEVTSDRIVEKSRPMLFEIGNFFATQWSGELLFLLHCLTFGDEAIVKSASPFVCHECIDTPTDKYHIRFFQNRLAKLLCLAENCGPFKSCFHDHSLMHPKREKQLKAVDSRRRTAGRPVAPGFSCSSRRRDDPVFRRRGDGAFLCAGRGWMMVPRWRSFQMPRRRKTKRVVRGHRLL